MLGSSNESRLVPFRAKNLDLLNEELSFLLAESEMKLALINGVNDIESKVLLISDIWLISDIKDPCSRVVHADAVDNADLEQIGVEDESINAGLDAMLFRFED